MVSSKFLNRNRRIEVLEERRWVPIVNQAPALSSASYGWEGVVERHLRLHVGASARQGWRVGGKSFHIRASAGMVNWPKLRR